MGFDYRIENDLLIGDRTAGKRLQLNLRLVQAIRRSSNSKDDKTPVRRAADVGTSLAHQFENALLALRASILYEGV
jgi:hypothetical protein